MQWTSWVIFQICQPHGPYKAILWKCGESWHIESSNKRVLFPTNPNILNTWKHLTCSVISQVYHPQPYIRSTYKCSKFLNHSWPTRHHPLVDPVDPVDPVEPVDPVDPVEQVVEPVEAAKLELVQLVQLGQSFGHPGCRRTRNALVWVGSAYEALNSVWKHWYCQYFCSAISR